VLFLLACPVVHAAEPPKARPVEEETSPIPIPPPLESVPALGPMPVPGVAPAAAVIPKVISNSRQFVVTGGLPEIRSSVAILAEEAKSALLELAQMKDEWKVPITIRLVGKAGDPPPAHSVEMSWFLDEQQAWAWEVILHVEHGIDQERFNRAITAALLYEQVLRKLPPSSQQTALLVQPWLVEGIQEAIDWKAGRSDRKLYEALVQHGGLYKLNDLFEVKEEAYEALDGGTRAGFRVAAGAMVMALLEQSKGKDGFKRFISEAANFSGDMPMLMKRCFPDLNLSETSLTKWWQLQIMDIKEPKLTDTLSVEETDATLEEAIRLRFRDASGAFIEKPLVAGWPDLAGLSQAARAEALRPTEDGIVRLSYRCFPSYRPLIDEYQSILADIVRGKTAATAARLAKVAETRNTMRAREHQAHDYMDWFEITHARATSGVLEDYLKLKDRLNYAAPTRQDPVSLYLDGAQKIFSGNPPRK